MNRNPLFGKFKRSRLANAFASLPKAEPIVKPIIANIPPPAPEAPIAPAEAVSLLLPTQSKWALDNSPLKIWEKSRQVGATMTDSLHSVLIVSVANALFDVWITSRDEIAANLYGDDARRWAKILNVAANDLGWVMLDRRQKFSARVIEFANGRRIYCLSSNPNALAGKRGHVKMDEFALHEDQELLYRVAKPVTQWGGTLSIISTHRGPETLFNRFINDVRYRGNPMGWELYSYPIQKAVEEGIVQRINEKSGRNETNEEFLARNHKQCANEESWLQEYCCTPSDINSAFFSYEMINACTDPTLKIARSVPEFLAYIQARSEETGNGHQSSNPPIQQSSFYVGVDVARSNDLFVMDVGEKIGNVMWDRCRIELHNRPFGEMEQNLWPVLALPQVKRVCIDAQGNGEQLWERSRGAYGWKVEGVKFTHATKEQAAFALRNDFEDGRLRISADEPLRADLRALKKESTKAGNICLEGRTEDSHCDRTWAKALRQHAARIRNEIGISVG